jgi:hypothetical protein
MKKILTPIIIFICLTVSCKKNKNECWIAFNNASGTDALDGTQVCGGTQAEAEALNPNYWFYSSLEPKYCWRLIKVSTGAVSYSANSLTTSIAQRYYVPAGYAITSVDCNSYCTWEFLQKRRSKITGLFNGGPRIMYETYVTDTCSKLFVGKVVNYIETTDSLITREYSKKIH